MEKIFYSAGSNVARCSPAPSGKPMRLVCVFCWRGGGGHWDKSWHVLRWCEDLQHRGLLGETTAHLIRMSGLTVCGDGSYSTHSS